MVSEEQAPERKRLTAHLALYELGLWSALICASIVWNPSWGKDWLSLYLCGIAVLRMAVEIFRQQRAINQADERLAKFDAKLDELVAGD